MRRLGRRRLGRDPEHEPALLFRSTDRGKTWTRQEVTPVRGRYEYAWLSLTSDGKKLGFGVYYRPNNDLDWGVAGVTRPAGGTLNAKVRRSRPGPSGVSFAGHEEAPGDCLGSYFLPDGKLGVVWTRYVLWTDAARIFRDIYFIRQR